MCSGCSELIAVQRRPVQGSGGTLLATCRRQVELAKLHLVISVEGACHFYEEGEPATPGLLFERRMTLHSSRQAYRWCEATKIYQNVRSVSRGRRMARF